MADFNPIFLRVNGVIEGGDKIGQGSHWGLEQAGDLDPYNAENGTNYTLATLTQPQAYAVAQERYYQPLKISQINNQIVGQAIYACGLNQGIVTAVMISQRAYNSLELSTQLTVDGVLGPATLAAINAVCATSPGTFLTAFAVYRKESYDATMAAKPEEAINKQGWNRNIIMSSTPTPGDMGEQ